MEHFINHKIGDIVLYIWAGSGECDAYKISELSSDGVRYSEFAWDEISELNTSDSCACIINTNRLYIWSIL